MHVIAVLTSRMAPPRVCGAVCGTEMRVWWRVQRCRCARGPGTVPYLPSRILICAYTYPDIFLAYANSYADQSGRRRILYAYCVTMCLRVSVRQCAFRHERMVIFLRVSEPRCAFGEVHTRIRIAVRVLTRAYLLPGRSGEWGFGSPGLQLSLRQVTYPPTNSLRTPYELPSNCCSIPLRTTNYQHSLAKYYEQAANVLRTDGSMLNSTR
eukprot:1089174-Rhodomonas_salina.2